MTLTDQVAQFMYTHMAQAPNRKELLKLVETVEFTYITRIADLEKQLADKDKDKVAISRWDEL